MERWYIKTRVRIFNANDIVWRKKIFIRDNFTCIICSKKGGVLNAHHIKAWSEYKALRTDLSNGITVCDSCHKKIHKGEREIDGSLVDRRVNIEM